MLSRASYRFASNKVQESIVGPIAYAGGLHLRDQRTGTRHNYGSRRQAGRDDVIESKQFSPSVVRETLESSWNRVTRNNKHRRAVYGRRLLQILPKELSLEGMWRAARLFARYLSIKYSVAVFTALHGPRRSSDKKYRLEEEDEVDDSNGNWHLHTYLSYCTVNRDGTLGTKQVLLDPKSCEALGVRNFCEIERPVWAECVNRQLARERIEDRVDHRSNEDRGIPDLPMEHLGPRFAALERCGVKTHIGDRNRAIRKRNARVRRGAPHLANLKAWVVAFSSAPSTWDTRRLAHSGRWRAKMFHHGPRATVRAFSRSLGIVLMKDGGALSLDGRTVVILQPGAARQAYDLIEVVRAEVARDRTSEASRRIRAQKDRKRRPNRDQTVRSAVRNDASVMPRKDQPQSVERLIPRYGQGPDALQNDDRADRNIGWKNGDDDAERP